MLDIATGVVSHSFLSPPTHSVISSCWSFPSPLWQSCSRSLNLCSRNKLFFYPQGLQNSQNILNLLWHHCNWQTPLELGFEEKVRLLTVHANHPSPKRFLGILLDLGGAFLNSESYEFIFFKGATSHSRKGTLDTSLASVTRETGSDESMSHLSIIRHLLRWKRRNLFLGTWPWEDRQVGSYRWLSHCLMEADNKTNTKEGQVERRKVTKPCGQSRASTSSLSPNWVA